MCLCSYAHYSTSIAQVIPASYNRHYSFLCFVDALFSFLFFIIVMVVFLCNCGSMLTIFQVSNGKRVEEITAYVDR